jgi:uncharacterized metal-binding protein
MAQRCAKDIERKGKTKMEQSNRCESTRNETEKPQYETAKIEKTNNICPMCESYARDQAAKPIAIMCCEGGCLRGEIARQASNLVCHKLVPDKTVRVCLGGAFTKNTGQRNLVRNAAQVIALEGCFIECASRMMKGVVPDLNPQVIAVDSLYDFDRSLFGIDQMAEEEIRAHAMTVAQKIVGGLRDLATPDAAQPCHRSCSM